MAVQYNDGAISTLLRGPRGVDLASASMGKCGLMTPSSSSCTQLTGEPLERIVGSIYQRTWHILVDMIGIAYLEVAHGTKIGSESFTNHSIT